jgi:uncharacterized protein YdhG (YjbR/CyaY superfamily)
MSTVEDYLAGYDGEARARLERIREIVREVAPEAVEGPAYGMVGWKLHKKPLVYTGGFTHHTGLYAIPQTHEAFVEELAAFKQGKGSVQFPLDQPLPEGLIRRMVVFRAEAILAVTAR